MDNAKPAKVDEACPTCGYPMDWVGCDFCPPDDYYGCEACNGDGGWWRCERCETTAHAEAGGNDGEEA